MINISTIITGLRKTYPALSYKNFRYFWFGQCISLIGTWMQTTAQAWLVYTLTKSALLLGFLGVAQFGPVMCLSLFAGVVVDRYPKRQLLIFTQVSLMIQAFVLTLLVWSGHIVYWEVLVLAAVLGLVNTLDAPTRQALMPELVGRRDLRSAIGLNSAIVNGARIIGPAVAAALMSRFGAGILFFLNCVSFIPVIIGLSLIKLDSVLVKKTEKKALRELRDGLKYIVHSPIILSTILSMLAVGTFVMNFNVVIPLYATEVLHEGVHGYGLLLSASGTGSFLGALLVASRAKGTPRLRLLFISALLVSGLLMILNFIHIFLLAAFLFVMIGFVNIVFITTANSSLQLNSSDEFRGRVMSVYTFAFMGTTPIGNVFAGFVTEKLGPGMGFLICGAVSGALVLITVFTVFVHKCYIAQN